MCRPAASEQQRQVAAGSGGGGRRRRRQQLTRRGAAAFRRVTGHRLRLLLKQLEGPAGLHARALPGAPPESALTPTCMLEDWERRDQVCKTGPGETAKTSSQHLLPQPPLCCSLSLRGASTPAIKNLQIASMRSLVAAPPQVTTAGHRRRRRRQPRLSYAGVCLWLWQPSRSPLVALCANSSVSRFFPQSHEQGSC